MNEWTISAEKRGAVIEKACALLSREIEKDCGYKPCRVDGSDGKGNSVTLSVRPGLPAQGYEINVKEGNEVFIYGGDECGVLYGVVDFIGEYIRKVVPLSYDIFLENAFERVFEKSFPVWRLAAAPSVAERAIWSWGHCIYDYKKFFENMAMLKLNMVVIWNDEVPKNALEVISEAHSYGIKVIFGYAWGWDNTQNQGDYITPEAKAKLKESCVKKYESEYLPLGLDGIYFQSFTETTEEFMGERSIASVVTELVNDISGELLKRHPELRIQFGLHALSVRNRLFEIEKTDKRLEIIWEDCGAFPYDYRPDKIDGYEKTLEFQDKIAVLRGEDDRFGVVLKGMTKLDWMSFVHQNDSAIGVRGDAFVAERRKKRSSLWRALRAEWLKNFDYAHRAIKQMADTKNGKLNIQLLVEDGVVESGADLALKIAAQTLWNASRSKEEIFESAVLSLGDGE